MNRQRAWLSEVVKFQKIFQEINYRNDLYKDYEGTAALRRAVRLLFPIHTQIRWAHSPLCARASSVMI